MTLSLFVEELGVQNWTYLLVGITFTLYIGIAIWTRAGSTKEFYVAGGGVSPLANGMATAADWMSAASFISMAGIISFDGYDGAVYLMGWTGGYVLLALLLAPYLRKFGKFTVPDFIGDRYYSNTARLVGVICALLVSFTYVAGQMRGVGLVFSRFLEVDINTGVIIGMLIVLFYAVLGGMKGITYTQVAQYCVLWIHKVPYGVTVGIAAWNFPFALSCRKIGPALTTGNVMVVKPPSVTPVAVMELGRLATEAGIPPGVLNLVTGGGATMGEELVTNKLTKLVTMTGSTVTGQEIFKKAAENLTAVRLELGGKAPFILLEDGDVDKAVQAAVDSRHLNNGQVCTCPERFYIHEDVYDEFLEKYTAVVSKLKLGDPLDESTDIGPKVNAYETDQLEKIVNKAVEQGAKVVCGGKRPEGAQFEKGHWYEATILTECTNEMDVMRDEVFGVVSPIMKISSYEEALELSNDSDYGLAAFLFTQDMRKIQRAVLELEFGEVYVNRPMGEQRQGFHNGHKLSGTGGEDGKWGMENYLEKKTLYVNFS